MPKDSHWYERKQGRCQGHVRPFQTKPLWTKKLFICFGKENTKNSLKPVSYDYVYCVSKMYPDNCILHSKYFILPNKGPQIQKIRVMIQKLSYEHYPVISTSRYLDINGRSLAMSR